jgi:hypothetical protein
MSGGLVFELRDVLAILAMVGTPFGVWAAMRSTIAELKTQVAALTLEIRDLKHSRESHSDGLGDIRERQAAHEARIVALERHRAEDTGQHRAVERIPTGGYPTIRRRPPKPEE